MAEYEADMELWTHSEGTEGAPNIPLHFPGQLLMDIMDAALQVRVLEQSPCLTGI